MNQKKSNLAFVFPGQGSQAVGMLAELASENPIVKSLFGQASEVLGYDLWQLVSEGPEAELNQTQRTQPAMLAAGVAMWELWCHKSNCRPFWMAGHSLGEYTALVCANAITFEDGIRLVAARGHFMQAAVPTGVGAMAAVLGLEDDVVSQVCDEVAGDEVVSPVNFNAPGQVVIAGHVAAVDRAIVALKLAGAKKVVVLPVSVPSHCALMRSAAEQFAIELENVPIKEPEFALVHNVDAQSHSSPEAIRKVLKEQLYKPVRWVECINYMQAQGVTNLVECGPGKVLVGLNKRIAKAAGHLSIYDSATLNIAWEQLNG
ncbi:MAG: ACP S-malonyltransferase [Methylococcaceae bacterium]|jgi:[acyl-carrier-protein] S-malonyltransferase